MDYNVVYFMVTVTLFIFGFHNVTRYDKLLSFLGSDYDPIIEELIEKRMDLAEEMIPDVRYEEELSKEIYEEKKKEMDDIEKKIGLLKYKCIKSKYDLRKPFSECVSCMSSFWTVVLMFAMPNESWSSSWMDFVLMAPILSVSVSGLVYVVCKIK